MGSEHYCLRWNNHQANLLGVFSQLLQDERLVDVTLACSEGTPIRAHKVVLSACSSYFQSLFLDHPEKHPIVILKDVRFAELQTLVEFMYKGEVNVQYCQLSALLKTAESLKVKGLAEMTNQNTTLREPEREPDRLRQHTQPNKGATTTSVCDSPIDASLSGPTTSSLGGNSLANASQTPSAGSANLSTSASLATNLTQTSAAASSASASGSTSGSGSGSGSALSSSSSTLNLLKRDASDSGSPTPPSKRQQTTNEQNSLMPLDLYQRRRDNPDHQSNNERYARDQPLSATSNSFNDHQHQQQQQRSMTPRNYSNTPSGTITNPNQDLSDSRSPGRLQENIVNICKEEDSNDGYDDNMDLSYDNSAQEVGLNMKIKTLNNNNSNSGVDLTSSSSAMHSPAAGSHVGLDIESARSTPAITIASDLTHRPSSRSSRDLSERPSSSGVLPSTSSLISPATITSNADSEPIAGPSGLAPIQSVPLSLKKEIDCSDDDTNNSRHMPTRATSASGGLSADLDYRASHESETSQSPRASGSGACSTGGSLATTNLSEQPLTPPPMYPCLYCGAAYSNQTKLTRHILSHSLKSLECRETATHPLLHPAMLAHELSMNPLPQQFAYQMNAAMAAGGSDPQESAAAVAAAAAAAMEMEFVSAVRACSMPSLASTCSNNRTLDLEGSGTSGGGVSGSSSNVCGRTGSSTSGNGNSLLLSGSSSATSTSINLPGTSGNSDPNSVVLCDRPFKCEFCGKAFKLRHHMKDHCRVHTGERPFRCHMCGKTFSRSTILKAHEKTHFPKYVRKFLSPSPIDTKDELPQ